MTVTVYPMRLTVNEWGEEHSTPCEPVTQRCTVQWQNANETSDLAVAPATAVKVIAREWAGHENCRFVWDGNTFEQVGHTERFAGSALTEHVEVYGRLVAVKGNSNGENVLPGGRI